MERIVFAGSALFLTLGGTWMFGALSAHNGVFPWPPLENAGALVARYLETGVVGPEFRVLVAPPGQTRQTVAVHDGAADGYTAIMLWDQAAQSYAARLLDSAGTAIHSWPIDYLAVDPEGPPGGSDTPHGLEILPDGSIVVSFDLGKAMARLDACGQPMWVAPGVYHHSVHRADDGSLWAWMGEGATAYGDYQYIVNVDMETGETIRSIGLVEDVIGKHDDHTRFGLPEGYRFVKQVPGLDIEEDDIWHVNDVEVLSAELAGAFEQFEAGDLLVSLRTINMIAVLDGRSGKVKWAANGPWRMQHDPDFLPDGRIALFNNNSFRSKQSQVLVVDPVTGETTSWFEGGEPEFFTKWMGKVQVLPRGNILVTIPGEGRVIQATRDGEIVFEYVNVINEKSNGHVENAIWLPPDFFSSPPYCPTDATSGAQRSKK